jgi:hypothetical protein
MTVSGTLKCRMRSVTSSTTIWPAADVSDKSAALSWFALISSRKLWLENDHAGPVTPATGGSNWSASVNVALFAATKSYVALDEG